MRTLVANAGSRTELQDDLSQWTLRPVTDGDRWTGTKTEYALKNECVPIRVFYVANEMHIRCKCGSQLYICRTF